MKVLIVGSGGREHTLAWKIAQSPRVEKIFAAPGNAGIARVAECIDAGAEDLDGLLRFARGVRPDLTVVGPEAPLVRGIVDRLEAENLRAFGPSKRAAELEGSKVFMKQLCRRHGIPTADFRIFEDPAKARAYVQEFSGSPGTELPAGRGGLVVKADGLAAGKGVLVCDSAEEALAAIDTIMVERAFGEAGRRIVIEERLEGEECSILAITDGRIILTLPSAQDHKRALDGDEGPNTGGMGAYSPAPVATEALLDRVIGEVIVPTVHAMGRESRPYRGVLYAGIMVTRNGPRVLEFNVRFGDPETQAILPRLKSDLVPVLEGVAAGSLEDASFELDERSAVCVALASGGYPGRYEKGKVITGLEEAEATGAVVFHAGTARKGKDVVTAGGRVLGVTALGDSIQEAIDAAYAGVERISFEGAHWRSDIGARALQRAGRNSARESGGGA